LCIVLVRVVVLAPGQEAPIDERRQTGRPTCLADWTETMNKQACFDAAARW